MTQQKAHAKKSFYLVFSLIPLNPSANPSIFVAVFFKWLKTFQFDTLIIMLQEWRNSSK